MEELLNRVHQKMNEEMNQPHSRFEDAIHNWLSEQTSNQKLLESILKEGKTIKDAASFVINKAQKQAERNVAAVSDDQVWKWVVEYFTGSETKVSGGSSAKVSKSDYQEEKIEKVDKKTAKSIDSILEMTIDDSEKIKMIQSLISSDKKESKEPIVKVEDATMSIFDFGIEDDPDEEYCES
jgi:hypothetical protein